VACLRRSGAAVDTQAVDIGADGRRMRDIADLIGKLRQPRRRVLHIEQRPGEAAEPPHDMPADNSNI